MPLFLNSDSTATLVWRWVGRFFPVKDHLTELSQNSKYFVNILYQKNLDRVCTHSFTPHLIYHTHSAGLLAPDKEQGQSRLLQEYVWSLFCLLVCFVFKRTNKRTFCQNVLLKSWKVKKWENISGNLEVTRFGYVSWDQLSEIKRDNPCHLALTSLSEWYPYF